MEDVINLRDREVGKELSCMACRSFDPQWDVGSPEVVLYCNRFNIEIKPTWTCDEHVRDSYRNILGKARCLQNNKVKGEGN